VIFGEDIPERYAAQWQYCPGGRYVREDGCEIVRDSGDPGWRAMVPVLSSAGRTAVWQALLSEDRVRLFSTATAAIDAVEAYLTMYS
jgi:hypothetical protein